VRAGQNGEVTAQIHVRRGPFGTNRVTCSRSQPCLLVLSQASYDPSEEADATISFAL
jgi:hypothetical protein